MDGADTIAGIATAEHFIDVLNFSIKSGETGALADLSASGCAPCQTLIGQIQELEQSGAWQTGGEIEPDEAVVPRDYASLRELPVQFNVQQQGSTVIDASGQRGEVYDEKQYVLQVVVTLEEGSWIVTDLVNAQ